MSITADRKQVLIKEYATKDGDTGSPGGPAQYTFSKLDRRAGPPGYPAEHARRLSDPSEGKRRAPLRARRAAA